MIREVSFNGNRIRIFDDGNIWVYATDIAKVMGYLNTTELTSNLGPDRKRISPHNTIVVNRDGFYRMTAARRNGEELRQFAKSNIFNLKSTTDIVIAEPKRTPETVVSYTSEQFGELRTIEINGAIWFAGVDVCRALQIQNTSQAMANLENDERCMFNIGRQGETNFINEWGLYSLILSSRKPEARAYRRWVTHKVLPSIHRTGSYSETGNTVDAILAFAAEFDALKSQYAQVVAERDALRATLDGIVAMANQTAQPTLEDPISYIHRNRGFLTSYITSCIGAYTYNNLKSTQFGIGWHKFYEQLAEALGSDVRLRGDKPYLNHVTDEEMPTAVSVANAMRSGLPLKVKDETMAVVQKVLAA